MTLKDQVQKFWKENEKIIVNGEEFAPNDIPDSIKLEDIDTLAEKVAQEDREVFKAWLKYEIQGKFPEGSGKVKPHEKTDSYEEKSEKLRKQIWKHMNKDTESGYESFELINTFDDAVIVKNYATDKMYEVKYVETDGEYFLGEPAEVKLQYVEKRMQDAGLEFSQKSECELTGPIVQKSIKQRIAYAAVLVPGELDSDGESVTKAKVEEAAHEWMKSYRNVDLQHSLNNVAVPVESYITTEERTVKAFGKNIVLPEGTWILASKVLDDTTWNRVEKGELTGYSVMGIKRTAFESASKSADMALKKTLLRDLGEDWVAAAVSIVDEPAVPKAKFFAIKEKIKEIPVTAEKEETDTATEGTWYQKIVRAIMPSEKAGRKISKSSREKIEAAMEALTELMKDATPDGDDDIDTKTKKEVQDVTNEELKVILDEAIKSAIEPLKEDIAALKATDKVDPAEKGDTAEPEESDKAEKGAPESESKEDKPEDMEAFKANVTQKLEEIEKKLAKKTAVSKSLVGQDGDATESTKARDDSRDGFGRTRK